MYWIIPELYGHCMPTALVSFLVTCGLYYIGIASFFIAGAWGCIAYSCDFWAQFFQALFHFMVAGGGFEGGSAFYAFEGLALEKLAGLGPTLSSEGARVFPYLQGLLSSFANIGWFLVYLCQRLISFACTDDIVMFSGICLVLDFLLEVLTFTLETAYTMTGFFVYHWALPFVFPYLSTEAFVDLVIFVDGAGMFYLELLFSLWVVYADYLFHWIIFLVDQYFVSFESVFFSLREFWPNSAGSRSFTLFYGWLIVICLVNRSMRNTIFGKPPSVPLVPRHVMDLYQ